MQCEPWWDMPIETTSTWLKKLLNVWIKRVALSPLEGKFIGSQMVGWNNMVHTNTLNYWWDHINNTRIKIYAKEINHPSIIPTLLASSLHFT